MIELMVVVLIIGILITIGLPIFLGARTRAENAAAGADLRNAMAAAKIYFSKGESYAGFGVAAAQEQLTVALQARELAAQQLAQARDRLSAGVGNSIEVVQAQEAVTLASEQYIGALYGLNTAKAGLVRGLGITEETVKQILGGVR